MLLIVEFSFQFVTIIIKKNIKELYYEKYM